MELTTKMIQGNLAYYLSKHTPLTEQQVNEQFEEWLLAFVENIIEVRENQIIKLLEERLTGCSGYECETCDEVSGIIRAIALIKGEK